MNKETSKEIYDDDVLYLDFPINAKYIFKEQRVFYEENY